MKKALAFVALFVSLSVLVNAQPYAEISYSQTPQPVFSGSTVLLHLTITNIGPSYAERTKVKILHIDQPLVLESSLPDNLGSLSAGNSLSTDIKIYVPSSTKTGYYNLQLQVSVCDSSTCRDYILQPVIEVESPISLNFKLQPNALPLDYQGRILLTISNKGSEIKNLQFTLFNPFIDILGSSNTFSFSDIQTNETVSLPLNISIKPGIEPSTYPFYIVGSYSDALGRIHTINTTVYVKLLGRIKLILSKESQSSISPDSKGSVYIKISNAGNEKAKFLLLNVSSKDFEIEPKTIYVGTLDSDDYDSEKLVLKPLKRLPGEYKLKIEMIYQDVYGNSYTETHYLSIAVTPKKQKVNLSLIYIVVAALAIAIIYTIVKRRKS